MRILKTKEPVTIAPGETIAIKTNFTVVLGGPLERTPMVIPNPDIELYSKLRVSMAPRLVPLAVGSNEYGLEVIVHNVSERYYTDGAGQVKVMPDRPANHCRVMPGHRDEEVDFKSSISKGWYDIEGDTPIAFVEL